MVNWFDVRAPPIRAIEHGVRESGVFNTEYVGPKTWERIDYPVGEVMPQSTSHTGGNEFTHSVFANLYFERSRDTDYVDDVLHPVAAVIEESLAALSNTESVVAYRAQSVEDFAGELDDTLILLVSIEFEVTTLVDLAET